MACQDFLNEFDSMLKEAVRSTSIVRCPKMSGAHGRCRLGELHLFGVQKNDRDIPGPFDFLGKPAFTSPYI